MFSFSKNTLSRKERKFVPFVSISTQRKVRMRSEAALHLIHVEFTIHYCNVSNILMRWIKTVTQSNHTKEMM